MAYTNHAYTIFENLKKILTSNINDLDVRNVHRLPDLETEKQGFLGRYRQALLLRIIEDVKEQQASDELERVYRFEGGLYLIDVLEDQQKLMDLVEKVKYYIYQNQTYTTGGSQIWYQAEVSAEYPEPVLQNIKHANLLIEVWRRGS